MCKNAVSAVEHKGLVDSEMQAISFQQGASWETIFSLLGCGKFWERGIKCVFPGVGLKGKYYLPTAAIISSSAVMTAGLERKKLIPEVSHINAKQAVTEGRKRKGEGCGLMDTILGDSALPVLETHQIALMCIIIKLSEPSLQLCLEAGSAENILSRFRMTFYTQ